MARVLVASDAFTGGDVAPLPSPPWGTYTDGLALSRFTNACFSTTYNNWNIETHNATLANDQYAEAKVLLPDAISGNGVLVRCNAPGGTLNGYLFYVGFGSDGAIYKFAGVASATLLQTCTGHVASNNDIISVEAVGTDVIAYINGVEVGRVTDGTYGSGVAGLGIYLGNGGADSLDDFACGNVTGTPSTFRSINYHGA